MESWDNAWQIKMLSLDDYWRLSKSLENPTRLIFFNESWPNLFLKVPTFLVDLLSIELMLHLFRVKQMYVNQCIAHMNGYWVYKSPVAQLFVQYAKDVT